MKHLSKEGITNDDTTACTGGPEVLPQIWTDARSIRRETAGVQGVPHAHEYLGIAMWPSHGPGTALRRNPDETKRLKWIVAKESV
jgi:hypothetical protein